MLPPWPDEDHVCEGCGIAYVAISDAEAMVTIRELPVRLRRAMVVLSPDRLAVRPAPDVWSVVEYLCHMRDVFTSATIRLYRLRTEAGPIVEPMLNDLRAARFGYREAAPAQVMQELDSAVAGFVAEVARASAADLDRTLVRQPGESRSGRWLVRQAMHEGVHHVADIAAAAHARTGPEPDSHWPTALHLAWEGFRAGTTPVGAVVVGPDGQLVASGRGRRFDPAGTDSVGGPIAGTQVAHAEINVLAQLPIGVPWQDHVLLTTLEPCGMCAGAARQTGIGRVVYAAPDPYAGTACLSFANSQWARRRPAFSGPLTDGRGAFSLMLHLAWLAGLPDNDHLIASHREVLPDFTDYVLAVRGRLEEAADFAAAWRLADAAPSYLGVAVP